MKGSWHCYDGEAWLEPVDNCVPRCGLVDKLICAAGQTWSPREVQRAEEEPMHWYWKMWQKFHCLRARDFIWLAKLVWVIPNASGGLPLVYAWSQQYLLFFEENIKNYIGNAFWEIAPEGICFMHSTKKMVAYSFFCYKIKQKNKNGGELSWK